MMIVVRQAAATKKLYQEAVSKNCKNKKREENESFKNKQSLCVLLLKLSVLHDCDISIEAGNKRKRVYLRMNALLEPNFCILEKSRIVCSPASLQAKKVLQIQFVCL